MTVWCVFEVEYGHKDLLFIRATEKDAEYEAFTERKLNPHYTIIEDWVVD